MEPSAADRANQDLIDRTIAQGALWSPPLIAAFRATPRHCFLDRVFQYLRKQERWREVSLRQLGPEEVRLVYSDRALITRLSASLPPTPISSSSQPSLMAQMLEDLALLPGQRILEIGAGTGYNAALLAYRVGPKRVVSMDVDGAVLEEAGGHLRAFAERGVQLRHGDGRLGCPELAPFERIMVTAATRDLEPAWLEQLLPNGLLLAPLALAPGLAYIVRGTVHDGVFHGRLLRGAYFMPLRSEDETGGGEGNAIAAGPLRTQSAPWADWFERRRPRLSWVGFIQALAFFGYLHGLTVAYRTLGDNQPAYVVSDEEQGCCCVLGPLHWEVTGPAARDLAWTLWRAFLDVGGPWPTEFHLEAVPHERAAESARAAGFVRQGPHCRHIWRLIENRERPALT